MVPVPVPTIQITAPPPAERRRLPDTRQSVTRKDRMGAFEFYVTVGFYADCPFQPGEVFIVIAKEGSTLSGMCDSLARTISVALQHGVPWPALSKQYHGMKFEPTGDHHTSLVDALASTIDRVIADRKSLWGVTESNA